MLTYKFYHAAKVIKPQLSVKADVNIPFTALRYFKTFEKALIMDMNG